MSLFSTLDGLVWRHLTNAPAFSASRLPDVPEKLSKTLKRPHLVLVGTRYQVSTKSGRIFFLFRRSAYLFFTCLWSGARKSPQKLRRFSRTVTKEYGLFGAKPLTKPPLKCRRTHTQLELSNLRRDGTTARRGRR